MLPRRGGAFAATTTLLLALLLLAAAPTPGFAREGQATWYPSIYQVRIDMGGWKRGREEVRPFRRCSEGKTASDCCSNKARARVRRTARLAHVMMDLAQPTLRLPPHSHSHTPTPNNTKHQPTSIKKGVVRLLQRRAAVRRRVARRAGRRRAVRQVLRRQVPPGDRAQRRR